MKQIILNHLKNLPGWKTKRKLVVFSVDDYGNVYLDSRMARDNMDKAGSKVHTRFDAYDALETHEDLETLYEVLTSVTDLNGQHAVFTPFALPCNIDFEKMSKENYQEYHYELLPDTFGKLSQQQPRAYEGAWKLWQEGISRGLLKPQFHGREHFNLKAFEGKLQASDSELMLALKNRSCANISTSGYPTIGWTAAFSFSELQELEIFPKILKTGTEAFESVYGYRASCFTPPAIEFPTSLESDLKQYGISFLDRQLHQNSHMGDGRYSWEWNYLGKKRSGGLTTLVRNVVFEPTHDSVAVSKAMKQIEAAFRLNKPANISSHRVNFCGHIDPSYRKKGLNALKELLHQMIKKWPDIEFISSDQLGSLITANEQK